MVVHPRLELPQGLNHVHHTEQRLRGSQGREGGREGAARREKGEGVTTALGGGSSPAGPI